MKDCTSILLSNCLQFSAKRDSVNSEKAGWRVMSSSSPFTPSAWIESMSRLAASLAVNRREGFLLLYNFYN